MPDPTPIPTPSPTDTGKEIKGWWTLAATLFAGSIERRMVVWMLFLTAQVVFVLNSVKPLISEAIDTMKPTVAVWAADPSLSVNWATGTWELPPLMPGWTAAKVEQRILAAGTAGTPTEAPFVTATYTIPATLAKDQQYQTQARIELRSPNGQLLFTRVYSDWHYLKP